MNNKEKGHIDIVYTFSKKNWTSSGICQSDRGSQWLEEANLFINKTIGFKKRALTDARFEGNRPRKP